MAYIPNKLLIFGAVAAAALAVPGLLGPQIFQEAEARHNDEHNPQASANNRATGNVVNLQAAVAVADALNQNDVTICVIARNCE